MTTDTSAPPPGGSPPLPGRRDGRDVRWENHRTQRRRQLVEATLRAIRRLGPGVGMDDIAAQATTSKTVLYRHFGDRAGVQLAVIEAVEDLIVADLTVASDGEEPVDRKIAAMVSAFLRLVQRDPAIYRFVLTRPAVELEPALGDTTGHDPLRRLTDRIGDRMTDVLTGAFGTGRDTEPPLSVWGHGIVGMVRAAADRWLDAGMPESPSALTDSIMALITPALTTLPTTQAEVSR